MFSGAPNLHIKKSINSKTSWANWYIKLSERVVLLQPTELAQSATTLTTLNNIKLARGDPLYTARFAQLYTLVSSYNKETFYFIKTISTSCVSKKYYIQLWGALYREKENFILMKYFKPCDLYWIQKEFLGFIFISKIFLIRRSILVNCSIEKKGSM